MTMEAASKAIMNVFDQVIKQEIAEADQVRAEIKQKGTYWAGDEIWKLRRDVAYWKKAAQEARAAQSRERW
jgi:spore coat protein CotF